MQPQSAERVRREIIWLCHAGLDSRTLRIELIKRLRKVIPIDVSFFTTADPATLLFTGAVADEILERATPNSSRTSSCGTMSTNSPDSPEVRGRLEV